MTKRLVLAYINKIFDPVGLVCPATLTLKLLLQSTWAAKLGWDDKLPETVEKKLKKWHKEIQSLRNIKINRDLTGGQGLKVGSSEIHTFCDASQDAYATVIFLRTTDEYKQVSVQLMMAKSRLAPLKRPSIPRMELLACVVGARLTHFLKESLQLTNLPCYLWSDSTTALAWIKRNDEWGSFVGNRVKEICSLVKVEDWRHVPGIYNPADLPSRGCSPAQLLESRWWNGPAWLYHSSRDWPVEESTWDEEAIREEQRKKPVLKLRQEELSSEEKDNRSQENSVVLLVRSVLEEVKGNTSLVFALIKLSKKYSDDGMAETICY